MARRIITTHTCDMSGVESDEVRTHTFALDGRTWEIDLSPEQHDRLLDATFPFMQEGRPVKANGKVSKSGPDPKIVRAWALANGVPVSERGRIKAEVVAQYVERAA